MKRRYWRFIASFTLVEMLTVIAIIAILAGLVLSAASGVMKTAARSRTRAEIGGVSAALESYHEDNGIYPPSTASGFNDTNYEVGGDGAPTGNPLYQNSSAALYQSLTGQTNYGDPPPTWGTKVYMTFKSSQLGNDTAGSNPIYIKDPFGNSYGYFTGGGGVSPINGTNQFDLWSTGGDVSGTPAGVSTWISNCGLGS